MGMLSSGNFSFQSLACKTVNAYMHVCMIVYACREFVLKTIGSEFFLC